MAGEHSSPSEVIDEELDKLRELTRPDAITALSEAAESDELWEVAERDPRAFLEERRVSVPAEVEISVFEGVCPDIPWGPDECPPYTVKRTKIYSYPICARGVRICVGETCIQFCLKWRQCAARVVWCDWIERPPFKFPKWPPRPGEGGPAPNL